MRKYRKKLYTALLALLTLGLCAGCYLRMRDAIPDRVYVVEGEKDALEENLEVYENLLAFGVA